MLTADKATLEAELEASQRSLKKVCFSIFVDLSDDWTRLDLTRPFTCRTAQANEVLQDQSDELEKRRIEVRISGSLFFPHAYLFQAHSSLSLSLCSSLSLSFSPFLPSCAYCRCIVCRMT